MILIAVAAALYVVAAACARRRRLSYGLAFVGSLTALGAGILSLVTPTGAVEVPILGAFSVSLYLDATSAVFLIISSLAGSLLSLFATDYGKLYGPRTASSFSLGFAATLLVVCAGDALTYLGGWELMTIFAYLMMTDDVRFDASGRSDPRKPLSSDAYRFLIFGEISTVLLMVGFAVLFIEFRTLSFAEVRAAGPAFLVLTTLGVAIKMDVIPFHIWMPGVYEQTADHVSAFLSVPLTLMGVYGLERFTSIGAPAPVWYMLLALLGAATSFWGALHAAAARKLKSLPAYSTVETSGMIVAVIATAALARSSGTDSLSYLAGFAGAAAAILALGHAVAKSLLFMSIGHAKESLDVRTIDETRGVWRAVGTAPGLGIVVAGLSLSAFPPLLGYTGEWMVLETVFQSSRFPVLVEQLFLAIAGVLVALAIGLSLFAMVKLIGYTALGYHHERYAKPVRDTSMKTAEVAGAVLLVLLGVGVPLVLGAFGFGGLFGGLLGVPAPLLLLSGQPLFGVVSPTMFAVVIIALAAIPLLVWRLRSKRVRRVEPWYGGERLQEREFFSEPAFSQILLHMLRRVYGTEEGTGDGTRQLVFRDRFVAPLTSIADALRRAGTLLARWFMNGHVYYYVIYIMLAFVVVLLIPW